MNKFKIFCLQLIIQLLESFIWALLLGIYALLFKELSFNEAIATLILSLVFIIYKSFLDLLPFFIITVIKAKGQHLELSMLQHARAFAAIFPLTVLLLLVTDNNEFWPLLIMYLPSILLTYLLFKKWWLKGIAWSNG